MFDDTGSLKPRYLHGPNVDQVFLSEDEWNEVFWALDDNQGTVRDIVKYDDVADLVTNVNHIIYNSFGEIQSETDPATGQAPTEASIKEGDYLYAYTGRIWDEDAQLYYYRARWYDPVTAEFVGEDPLGFIAGDVKLDRYVNNDPINAVDPSGLIEWNINTWHHIYPQADTFINFLRDNDIDPGWVHNPKNGWYLLWEHHLQLHGRRVTDELGRLRSYNAAWLDWIDSRKGMKTTTAHIEEQMEKMLRRYGLTDGYGNSIVGKRVTDVDGMSYSDRRSMNKKERAAWRKQRKVKGYCPSADEYKDAEQGNQARQRRRAAKIKQTKPVTNTKRGEPVTEPDKPGKVSPRPDRKPPGRFGRTLRGTFRILGVLDPIFFVRDMYDLNKRAKENGRTFDEQNTIDVETSPYMGTPLPMPNPWYCPQNHDPFRRPTT